MSDGDTSFIGFGGATRESWRSLDGYRCWASVNGFGSWGGVRWLAEGEAGSAWPDEPEQLDTAPRVGVTQLIQVEEPFACRLREPFWCLFEPRCFQDEKSWDDDPEAFRGIALVRLSATHVVRAEASRAVLRCHTLESLRLDGWGGLTETDRVVPDALFMLWDRQTWCWHSGGLTVLRGGRECIQLHWMILDLASRPARLIAYDDGDCVGLGPARISTRVDEFFRGLLPRTAARFRRADPGRDEPR